MIARALAFIREASPSLYAYLDPFLRFVYQKTPGLRRSLRRQRLVIRAHLTSATGLDRHNEDRIRWKQKWTNGGAAKVLMVAPRDYAGSFYGWATAVNAHSQDASCRLLALSKHRFQYKYDMVYPFYELFGTDHKPIRQLIDEADALHLKDEFYFFETTWKPEVSRFMNALIEAFQKTNRPVIFTHYGSFARNFEQNPSYRKAVAAFDARIAITPDLLFDWFGGEYVPHAIDLTEVPRTWTESRIFAHSPSSKVIKGSGVMWEALHRVEEIKDGWTLDMISEVSHRECLARMSRAELFFDQAGKDDVRAADKNRVIGWYGKAAVEAMSFGIPTIAHLSEVALTRATRAGKDIRAICPVLNTGVDRASMEETLVKYLGLSPEEKRDLSDRTRRWVERFHGERVVAGELSRIYRACLNSGKAAPSTKVSEK